VWYVLQCVWASTTPKRWMALSRLVWSGWPTFATATSLKLLYYIQTTILIAALLKAINLAFAKMGRGCPALLLFLAQRIFFGLCGFDTFLYKTQFLAAQISAILEMEEGPSRSASTQAVTIQSVVFINQMLSVVQLGRYSRRRIFVFMFAGEDGQIDAVEDARKQIWEGMFAMWCWEQLKWYQAISVYMSFSDYDFQKLVLDNKEGSSEEENKGKVATSSNAFADVLGNIGF